MFDLKGKVALVTGAASGIGFACVKELLRNELKGVALVDVSVARGSKALDEITREFGKDRAVFVNADVSDRTQLEEAFETTVKTFKQLDIVINNAGIIQEISWERCISVNLTGVITGSMLAMEKYFPKYRSTPEAVILNTASIAGLEAFEDLPAYTATKFGVVGFTRAMGGDVHYQTTKVRVVAICPDRTDTPLADVTKDQISEPFLCRYLNYAKNTPPQKPEDLAKQAMDLLRNAPNGSVWNSAINQNCNQVEFPKF